MPRGTRCGARGSHISRNGCENSRSVWIYVWLCVSVIFTVYVGLSGRTAELTHSLQDCAGECEVGLAQSSRHTVCDTCAAWMQFFEADL